MTRDMIEMCQLIIVVCLGENMIKILLLSGFDITDAHSCTNANAICVTKIVEALKEFTDVTVDIACNGVVEKIPVKNWKCNPLYTLRRIIRWPSCNPNVETACRGELFDILDKKEYDCLFVPHKPFETVYAACIAKRKFPNIKFYIYALDPIANDIEANNGMGKYLSFLSKMAEKRVFQTADHVFHMECNREKYSDVIYQNYWDKFSYLDFPLIDIKNRHVSKMAENVAESIKIIYSGLLNNTFRDPEYFLDVFECTCKKVDVKVDFFSKGNSIKKIIKRGRNQAINYCGYIPKYELETRMEEADFFLNIGNSYSSMLPSKLLTYIKTGKPIIHVQKQENDVAIPYLEKYGLALIINEKEMVEESACKLASFLKDNYHKQLSSDYVESLFIENTPRWNVKQIVLQLRKNIPQT